MLTIKASLYYQRIKVYFFSNITVYARFLKALFNQFLVHNIQYVIKIILHKGNDRISSGPGKVLEKLMVSLIFFIKCLCPLTFRRSYKPWRIWSLSLLLIISSLPQFCSSFHNSPSLSQIFPSFSKFIAILVQYLISLNLWDIGMWSCWRNTL